MGRHGLGDQVIDDQSPQVPVRVDDNGKPIPDAAPVRVDDSGRPIVGTAPQLSTFDKLVQVLHHAAQAVATGNPQAIGDDVVQAAIAHPAAAGATVAGALTAPFTGGMSLLPALGMAGAMGAGGAALGSLAGDVIDPRTVETGGNVPTPMGAAKTIAEQGALSLAGEGIGRGVAAGINALTPTVANFLYRMGLGQTAAMKRNFPTAAATGLSENIIPTADRVQQRLSEVESDLMDQVRAVDNARPVVRGYLGPATTDVPLGIAPTGEGPMVVSPSAQVSQAGSPRSILTRTDDPLFLVEGTAPEPKAGFGGPGTVQMPRPQVAGEAGTAPPTMVAPKDIVQQAIAFVQQKGNLGARAFKSDANDELTRLAQQYLADNSAPMTLEQSLAQKRAEQAIASASYHSQALGHPINDIETLFHQGIANAQRQAVLDRVPGAAQSLATEQGLIGLKNAAQYAADRPDTMPKAMQLISAIYGAGNLAQGNFAQGTTEMASAAALAASRSPTAMGALAIFTKMLGQNAAPYLPAFTKAVANVYGGITDSPLDKNTTVTMGVPVVAPDQPPFNPPTIKGNLPIR